jgi:hypothetical protein
MKYAELRNINVNEHIEKKNGLSYLSWAWAVDQLLLLDEAATWEYAEPKQYGETMMVFCTVTAFGRSRTAQLPVMDHRNKAIPKPDAFQINTAMQRCLAKAISLHGIGLYIYAGEDLPEEDKGSAKVQNIQNTEPPKPVFTEERIAAIQVAVDAAIDAFQAGDVAAAHDFIYGLQDTDEVLEAWGILKPHSTLRNQVKKYRTEHVTQPQKEAA